MAAYFPVFQFLIIILCILCSHQFHLTIAKPTTVFSLKLIHRDSPHSPLYPGNLSDANQIRRLVHFSESRILHLQSKVAAANSPSSNKVSIDQPDLLRPPIDRYGSVFLVLVSIGTPDKPYWLLFDIGSDLIWTQCKPCDPCFPQKEPTFNPKTSSSYKTLPCGHSLCKGKKCENGKCIYSMHYETPSVTTGVLSEETFTFLSDNGAPEPIRGIVFGCSHASDQGFTSFGGGIDGILGMSFSQLSLTGQIRNEIHQRFSYCFVHLWQYPRHISSFLRFGNNIVIRGGPVQTTPFVFYKPNPTLYALSLQDISIGNHRMRFPPGTFELKPDESGGCLIDTGTAITYIDTIPYEMVKTVLKLHFGYYHLREVDGGQYRLDLCYQLPTNFTNFPSITFHFKWADLKVKPENAFKNVPKDKNFCLLMKPKDGLTIIGAMQQQNTRFVFDIGKREVSFAPEDCSKDVE